MKLDKIESISKIIAAVIIPLVIAYMGNAFTEANKKQDTETKMIELATTILNREIGPNITEDTKRIRKWAVDVINTYSGVKMESATQEALIHKVSLPSNKPNEESNGTYGVVFSADKSLDEAKHEINVTAKKAGVESAQIFLRSGSYRSVIVFTSRPDAEEALGKLKQLRKDSFIVDMSKWCPNTTSINTYLECKIN